MVVQWYIPDIISINLRIIHFWWFKDKPMEKSMEESWEENGSQWDHGIFDAIISRSGWWFGTWTNIFHIIWDVILPIDFHIFQDG
jgi:hypothetical protein